MLVEGYARRYTGGPVTTRGNLLTNGSSRVKKGRHRRFEEARALKRLETDDHVEPCAECGAEPGADHASWCLAMEDLDDDEHDSEAEEAEVRPA